MKDKNIKLFFVSIIFFIFFFLATYPYILNLNKFFDDNSDLPQNSFVLWWNYHALITGKIFKPDHYFNTNILFYFPYNLSFFDISFTQSIIFSIFFLINKNYVLAINLTIIACFYLTYLSSFIVLKLLIKNIHASLIGALIFTFQPYIFHDHFPSSINLLGSYFIPILFFLSFKLFFQKKEFIRNLIVFSISFVLNAFTSTHYLIVSLIILTLCLITRLVFFNLKRIKQSLLFLKKKIFITSLTLFFSLSLILYFYQGYLKLYKQGVRRDLETNIYYSGSIKNYFIPSKETILYNFLKEKLKIAINNVTEKDLFLGFLNIIFFIIGIYIFLKSKKINLSFKFFTLLCLIMFFLLILGPVYKNIKLPYYYLMEVVHFQRVPTRYFIPFYFIFSLISSYGIIFLLKKIKINLLKHIVFFIIIFLLFIEIAPIDNSYFYNRSYFIEKIESYKKNEFIYKKLKDTNTIHFPSSNCCFTDSEAKYMSWATYTKEKVFNGHPAFLPNDYLILMKKIHNNENGLLENIKKINIKYIIIHKDILNNDWLKYTDYPKINSSKEIEFLKNFYLKLIEKNRDKIVFEDKKTIIIKII